MASASSTRGRLDGPQESSWALLRCATVLTLGSFVGGGASWRHAVGWASVAHGLPPRTKASKEAIGAGSDASVAAEGAEFLRAGEAAGGLGLPKK